MDGFTVVACDYNDDVPVRYICVNDMGMIKYAPFDVLQRIVEERPGFIRNLSLSKLSPPYAQFPKEQEGNLVGTILCCGTREEEKFFRVVGKRNNDWYIDDIDEEEAAIRIKRGHIVNGSARGKKVTCKCPMRQEIFESKGKRDTVPSHGKRVDITIHYITEATDENNNILRYAGMEFIGDAAIIAELLPGFTEKTVAFQQEFFNKFGRYADEFSLQSIPGKVFVVLPYMEAEKFLLSGKRPIKISRVIISALAYRGGNIFDESRVVLSGVLGCGEIRGSNVLLDAAVRKLSHEIQATFKSHVLLRSKLSKDPK